jgi:signal transduction histidine kinase
MRSLSARLVLAFALTSLAGIALAALLVRQFVVQEFDAYVLEQRRSAFVEQASAYYAEHGSWTGVAAALRAERQVGGPGGGGPPGRYSGGYGGYGGGGYGGGSPDGLAGSHFEFALADASGVVLMAANPQQRGQPARAADLASGAPVTVDGQVVGTVYALGPPVGRDPAEARYLARTDLALGAAALGAVAVALALGLLLARVITRPLRDLTSAARAIAGGDLRQQVPVRSRDEIGLLTVQFNAMSSGLARANELRRRMTADIAHDLRTPLTVIAGYLEALRDESLRPTPARFATMHDETQVLLRLVEDLHTLSLADAGELPLRRQPAAPERLIDRVATSYQHAAHQAGVALSVQAEPGLPDLQVDVEQVVRALGNLVSNALRHTPAGGSVALRAMLQEAGGRRPETGGRRPEAESGHLSPAPAACLLFEVRDSGEGIPAEHLPNIFERFYRADSSRQQASGGSGLGLAIVRSIVEAHGGQVAVASSPGQGTTFTLTLPTGPRA